MDGGGAQELHSGIKINPIKFLLGLRIVPAADSPVRPPFLTTGVPQNESTWQWHQNLLK